jgi:hypothetical protein
MKFCSPFPFLFENVEDVKVHAKVFNSIVLKTIDVYTYIRMYNHQNAYEILSINIYTLSNNCPYPLYLQWTKEINSRIITLNDFGEHKSEWSVVPKRG